ARPALDRAAALRGRGRPDRPLRSAGGRRRRPRRGARARGRHRGVGAARGALHPGNDARRPRRPCPCRDGPRGRGAGPPAPNERVGRRHPGRGRASDPALRGPMTDQASLDPAEIRAQLRRWIEAEWNADLSLLEWRTRLAAAGWACPTWPCEWGGRALPAAFAEIVGDALADAGVPGPPDGVGMHLAAPPVPEHGSDDLKPPRPA